MEASPALRPIPEEFLLDLYIDADACPVRAESFRVADRFDLRVFVVSNGPIDLPMDERLQGIRVPSGPDEADDWIAERAGAGDIVITDDLPLASRCIDREARVLTFRGRELDGSNIGDALATRDLLQSLRESGLETGGPGSFAKRDRSEFLMRLDDLVRSVQRNHPETP